jgi:MFS family permease
VFLVLASAFFGACAGMMYAATMTLQAAEFEAPEWVLTMIPMSLPTILALILLLPMGAYADSSGRRKELLILAIGLTALADIALYFVNSWQWLVGLRIITGLPFALMGLYSAILTFITPEERRGTAMALSAGTPMVGMALFQAISGKILGIVGHGGIYLISAGLGALSILLLLPVKVPVVKLPAGISGKDIKSVLSNRSILYTGVLFLFYLTGWQMLYGSFPAVMSSLFKAPAGLLTLLFAVASFMLGLGTFIWGPPIDKFGTRKMVLVGLGISMLATFLIAAFASKSMWGYVILFWISTFGGVVGAPSATTIASKSAKPELATLAINTMMMFINLPAIIGGLVAGPLAVVAGLVGMILVSAVLQLIGTLMTIRVPNV